MHVGNYYFTWFWMAVLGVHCIFLLVLIPQLLHPANTLRELAPPTAEEAHAKARRDRTFGASVNTLLLAGWVCTWAFSDSWW